MTMLLHRSIALDAQISKKGALAVEERNLTRSQYSPEVLFVQSPAQRPLLAAKRVTFPIQIQHSETVGNMPV